MLTCRNICAISLSAEPAMQRVAVTTGGTCPLPLLTKINFLIRPNFMRTVGGGGELRDSWQDFEMGVATRLDNNVRVSQPKSPNF